MKRHLSTAILCLLCLQTVYGQKNVDGKIPVIDVIGNLGTYRKVPVSKFVSEVEYVPLETGKDCLIDRIEDVVVTSSHIFVTGLTFCYAFTREGKFISDIGRPGRGPGEWTAMVIGISVDERNRIIYVDAGKKILEYTWDGKFVREIVKPSFNKSSVTTIPQDVSHRRDNIFMGRIKDYVKNEPPGWILFDDKGTVVKTIYSPTGNAFKTVKLWTSSRGMNSSISGQVYIKEEFNDTLYCLNRNDKLEPSFFFDIGKYSPLKSGIASLPFEQVVRRSYISIPANLPSLPPILLASDNIFFSLSFFNLTISGVKVPQGNTWILSAAGLPISPNEFEIDDTSTVLGLYDIASGKTELLDRDPVTRKYGLVNDIDGGLSFWPRYCNSANELIDVWQAFDMKDLLDEEYFSAHPAKDPEAHAKLRSLLKNLDENDNPVVVIAKLKK